jgi:iron(III) transport system substrate-binding protein
MAAIRTKAAFGTSRRRGLTRRVVAGLAVASLVVACGSGGGSSTSNSDAQEVETIEITEELIAAAKEEGRLLVRNGTPATTMSGLAEAFEKQYGITVQSDRKVGVVGTDQFRQEEQANNHVVDVMWNVDPPGAIDLAEEGYLQRFTLPDAEEILPPEAELGDHAAYVTYWYDVVIQYNPSLISPEEADKKFSTWRGLLDPDLAGGKIGMNEPAGGSIPFGTYLMWYQHEDYGREFLEDLAAQKPRLYPGSAPGREALAAGEIAVYIPNWEDIAMLNFMSGDKTQWTYPEVTPAIPAAFAAISANAPNPNAARLFTAWMFSEDGAQALIDLQGRPTRLGMEDTRTAIDLLEKTDWWEPMPEEILEIPDMDYWIENYDELMPDMREVLGWRG